MLEATRGRAGPGPQEKDILLVRRAAHQIHEISYKLLRIPSDLLFVVVSFADENDVIRYALIFELSLLKIRSEHDRSIDECIVVLCNITGRLRTRFHTRLNPPRRRSFEL